MAVDSPGCSYVSLLNHLGVGPNNHTHSALRPVRNWSTPTYVTVDLYLYVIIDVNEKHQSLTTGLHMFSSGWTNELLRWDPEHFCGIYTMTIPEEYVWRPPTSIMESFDAKLSYEKSSYVNLIASGWVTTGESYKITSTCKMDLFKFPFDTQQCKLTVLTILNTIDQIRLYPGSNSADVLSGSLMVFQAQGEWDLIRINVTRQNLTIGTSVWDTVIYTIVMCRRPQLYVINLLIPVFLFLVLDLMSFFINEVQGEKLSFKVTVLLAISVLLLILHDMLPSTHDRTPLIGVFCTGIFLFVGFSIVETIAVSFLMRMASKCDLAAFSRETREKRVQEEASGQGPVVSTVKGVEQDTAIVSLLRLLLEEVRKLRQSTCPQPARHAGSACVCLKTAAKAINTLYFILYTCAAVCFLVGVFKQWYY
ncbi:5-hydroxytryptamine receptor 3A-like [Engraulis encrasicolus]|uniref:5-hydroxytryptamine receptor 3A-like n=1 Tax=Engraulis encrasicolus TaxID=184585 RepID=UPI002FD2FC17